MPSIPCIDLLAACISDRSISSCGSQKLNQGRCAPAQPMRTPACARKPGGMRPGWYRDEEVHTRPTLLARIRSLCQARREAAKPAHRASCPAPPVSQPERRG